MVFIMFNNKKQKHVVWYRSFLDTIVFYFIFMYLLQVLDHNLCAALGHGDALHESSVERLQNILARPSLQIDDEILSRLIKMYAESHSTETSNIYQQLLPPVNILAISSDYTCKHVLPDDIHPLVLYFMFEDIPPPADQLTEIISRTSRRDFPFETQVNRFYSTSRSPWRNSNDCGDRIDVKVTPRVVLNGIGLHGAAGREVRVSASLIQAPSTEIAVTDSAFYTQSNEELKVLFPMPVTLNASVRYTITANCKGK